MAQQRHGSARRRQPALLEHDPDPGAVLGPSPPRVDAEDLHRAGIRALQPFETFDRRRLAGTVGAEDGGDLPGPRTPGGAVYGPYPAEGLAQIADGDCGGHVETS